MVVKSILELIGNTPIIELNKINQNLNGKLYAKVEKFNPAGSIKDRAAYQMLLDLFENGKLHKGDTIIEPTSGNTGIALACLSNYFSLNCIIIMPESMSIERRNLIKAFGAKLILVNGSMNDCVKKAKLLNQEIPNSIIVGQFDNPSNVKAHYLHTAQEIFSDLNDVDVIVAGFGTGGTITGIGKYVKDNHLNVEIVGVEPSSSPLVSKHYFGKHKIQGIGANFIPSILDISYIDRIVLIDDDEAIDKAKELVKKEGLFVGISSGASYAACLRLLEEEKYKNKKILFICPDTGERYQWN